MEHTAPLMSNDEVRSDGNGLAVSSRIVELAPSGDGGCSPTKLKRKETVLNDVTNTGVMAALIGGFALSCLQSTDFRLYESDHSTMDEIIYVLLVFAVHACTCSALTSAFLYREANVLEDGREIQAWAEKHWMLLMMPIAKFGMGCASYIISVIFLSFRTLEEVAVTRSIAVSIGIASMSTVVMTLGALYFR